MYRIPTLNGKIENPVYITGCHDKRRESVSFDVSGEDGAIIQGCMAVSVLLEEDNCVYRSGEDHFTLTQKQADELRFFTRAQRDSIKFSGEEKSFEKWREYGIPLEDYLPLDTVLNDEWFERLPIHIFMGDRIRQLSEPYKSPADRLKLNLTAYHTFLFVNKGAYSYMGICAWGRADNLVDDLTVQRRMPSVINGGV